MMKRMFYSAGMLFLCSLMASSALAARQPSNKQLSPERKLAEEALQQFLSMTRGEELRQFVHTWRNPGQVLRQVDRTELARQDSDIPRYLRMMEEYSLKSWMVQTLLFPGVSNSLHAPLGMEETAHDLSLVEGRCTWALEQLLEIELPPVIQKSSPEYTQAHSLAYDEWERRSQMRKAFNFLLIKSALPVSLEEKLALAKNESTPIQVLTALAHAREDAVRLAIIQHPYLDVHSQSKMAEHDPDPVVREIASEKRLSARPISEEPRLSISVKDFLFSHPIKTLQPGQEQPALLPFDLAIEEHLTAMRASWTAKTTLKAGEPGPQTLAEAAELLVKTLRLPDSPAFCAEGANTFYCSAGTSLEPGADLNSGFAIERGGTTIYSWGAPQK